MVGLALIVLGMVAGAIAAFSIADPRWSVAAAWLLSFATVGVAAGLLTLRRASWPDDAWPSASAQDSERQTRRTLLICGAFLLVACAAALLGLLLPDAAGEADATRSWWLVGSTGVIGAVLVIAGLAPIPPAVDSMERPPEDADADADAAWVRIGPPASAQRAGDVLGPLKSAQHLQVPLLLLSLLPAFFNLGTWVAAAVVAAAVAATAVMLVVRRRRSRPPWIARDGSAIRHGAVDLPTEEIDAASLSVVPWQADATERNLSMTITAAGKHRGTIALRRRGRLVLNASQTAALEALVTRSAIELPRDPSDPKGRFSRSSYPTHLTKEDALAVVREPPGDGEPLPILAQPGRP